MNKASVLIFTYNQAGYIRQALEGACTQTMKPLEIIVVDDASTDSTFDVAKEWISERGDPLVSIVRNKFNLGLVASISTWASQAKGDIVIPMAGDDISYSSRVEQAVRHFSSNPLSYALVASGKTIDKDGQLIGAYGNGVDRVIHLSALDPADGEFLRGLGATGASTSYRRELFTFFPPLCGGAFAEDRILCFRALLLGTCDFSSSNHVLWRRHEANVSRDTRLERNAALAKHFDRCGAMIQQHLDDLKQLGEGFSKKNQLLQKVLKYQRARWALWSAANSAGLPMLRFTAAWKEMRSHANSSSCLLLDSFRPALHLLTPFAIRQAVARFKSRFTKRQ